MAVGRTHMKVATLASERMFYVLRECLAPIKKTAKPFKLSGFILISVRCVQKYGRLSRILSHVQLS